MSFVRSSLRNLCNGCIWLHLVAFGYTVHLEWTKHKSQAVCDLCAKKFGKKWKKAPFAKISAPSKAEKCAERCTASNCKLMLAEDSLS